MALFCFSRSAFFLSAHLGFYMSDKKRAERRAPRLLLLSAALSHSRSLLEFEFCWFLVLGCWILTISAKSLLRYRILMILRWRGEETTLAVYFHGDYGSVDESGDCHRHFHSKCWLSDASSSESEASPSKGVTCLSRTRNALPASGAALATAGILRITCTLQLC